MGDWLCPHKIATKSMAMRRDLLFFPGDPVREWQQ